MVTEVVDASVTASPATWAASLALREISRIEAPICSLPAETVSTLREICSAAAETACDWSDGLLGRGGDLRGRTGHLLGRAGQRRRRTGRSW